MKTKPLILPELALSQHVAVLGKTGSGKSSTLRHCVEHLLSRKKRVCIIDPKGDWWGLKSSADGTGPGFPIITFGDFKNPEATDVPINAHSGKHVAELIASGNRPCIIGFRGWPTAQMVQFWIDFASGIFNANSGELYIVGDEFHNFAPKGKIMDPQAGKCLHWSNRLLSEGRGLGIVCLIASQRPQKVHNDTLTCCETLIALRVIHSADRNAIEDWIDGAGGKEAGRDVINTLSQMPRGEAWVWSPEIGFGPQRIQFPMFVSFDSFAPPQLQVKVSNKSWADVDLNTVKEKLAKVIEEEKSNDPRELKKQIQELTRKLNDKKPSIDVVKFRALIEEVEAQIAPMKANAQTALTIINALAARVEFYRTLLSENSPVNIGVDTTRGPSLAGAVVHYADKWERVARVAQTSMVPRHAAIINALGFYKTIGQSKINKSRLASFVARSNDGGFRNDLATLRTGGFIDYPVPSLVCLTDKGEAQIAELPNIKTDADLHEIWFKRMVPRYRQILQSLLGRFPESTSKDELASSLGRTNDGGFRNDLSALRTLGVIDYPNPGHVIASNNLFPFYTGAKRR